MLLYKKYFYFYQLQGSIIRPSSLSPHCYYWPLWSSYWPCAVWGAEPSRGGHRSRKLYNEALMVKNSQPIFHPFWISNKAPFKKWHIFLLFQKHLLASTHWNMKSYQCPFSGITRMHGQLSMLHHKYPRSSITESTIRSRPSPCFSLSRLTTRSASTEPVWTTGMLS